MKSREIGSNFWIDPDTVYEELPLGTPQQFGCNGVDYVWLSTGRSAIAMVLDEIEHTKPRRRKIAMIPAFTCDTVIEPFLKRGYKVYGYDINPQLMNSTAAILEEAIQKEVSVVLFHRYFGFDTLKWEEVDFQSFKNLDISTIEDCTQCLYSDFERLPVDFYVGSIRKWCAAPDGGFAVSSKSSFTCHPESPDVELERAKQNASIAKYKYLFMGEGDKKHFLSLYRDAEDLLDSRTSYFRISDLSVKIQTNLSRNEMSNARKQNYQQLSQLVEGMDDIVLPLGNVTNKTVPLYFPILVEHREKLQHYLAENAIFAPIVWPKASICPPVDDITQYIYDRLLCIPIDQRYGAEDMETISSVLREKND